MKKIKIIYTMTAPVSHIGQTASVGAYFNAIKTAWGEMPVITGNSVRGILRDYGAQELLDTYGVAVDKEVFNVLFSGGNISGATKNDVGRAKFVRQHFPIVSLLGGGLGTMIMSGNVLSGFLYPICMESEELTHIPSEVSWHDLMDEIEFTRMDDSKDDKKSKYCENAEAENTAKASTQMRISVQYMAPGTRFVQEITLLGSATEMEEAALYSAIARWFATPTLGGMRAKGFGFFDADSEEISVTGGRIVMSDRVRDLIDKYHAFLQAEDFEETIKLLATDGGGKKNGKSTNKTTASDGNAG